MNTQLQDVYKSLAQILDRLPNGFPSTGDDSEIRVLMKLFTPEEAAIAVLLGTEFETVETIALRGKRETNQLRKELKNMVRRGLISGDRFENGFGYKLMPFVVGIYEMQAGTIDQELAQLVEEYFKKAFGEALRQQPQFHRVIPIGETIQNIMEVQPYENASAIVNGAQAWGILDCICRKQKALIGEACDHPLDVCMAFDEHPGAFDNSPVIHAITREESLATLKRAAEAGLVHSVSNNQQGNSYICNCCTCSCGILRGMASLGVANVIARSSFVNTVDENLCNACESCLPWCQFNALTVDSVAKVDSVRCVGCGVCVLNCPTDALALVQRPEKELMPIPPTHEDWKIQRLSTRDNELKTNT